MRIASRVVSALAAAALAAGIAAHAVGASERSPEPGRSRVPSGECTAEGTARAVASFISAFNRGDLPRLDALFARPPAFGWVSSNAPGLRRADAAKDRTTLLAYFRGRHAKHDRIRLASFAFNGSSHGLGNFVMRLTRSASDYRRGARFSLIGKGAVACGADDAAAPAPVRFVVLSLGGPGSG